MHPSRSILLGIFSLAVIQVGGQSLNLTASSPHIYPGIPNMKGDFSDSAAWQKYFEVKNIPNVTFPLTRSFAGNIPVNRQGLNNTLFFWAFENVNGSLTSNTYNAPWGIWLNGGPGSSSMAGLIYENGPIHMASDNSVIGNPYSWNHALDMVWVDQPIGVGFSTADANAFVRDEDQMAEDFFGFLTNLVRVFPSLADRPLYLMGESYAGVYISYITKAYFSLVYPPVNLHKIVVGDGAYAPDETDILTSVVSVLETYPQLISYDTEVFKYFKEQAHLCKLDVNLTYPQIMPIPLVQPTIPFPSAGSAQNARQQYKVLRSLGSQSSRTLVEKKGTRLRFSEFSRRAWKRDLSNRPNGTIDPFYGCNLLTEAIDYARNFSSPWKGNKGFDVFEIPDATFPQAPPTPNSPGIFLNDPRVKSAIHAPDKEWVLTFAPGFGYPFGGTNSGDPSPLPTTFFSEFAKNLSIHGISWALYSGNADMLLPHRGTEIVIQNISFSEHQRGFTRKPGTPWYEANGKLAGIVHQEHNLTYVLFNNAGHTVPTDVPATALSFVRRFVIGNDNLGTVLPNGSVVGGEKLAQDILPAVSAPIFFGSGAIKGTKIYPSATIAAWNKFTATANTYPTGMAN